VAAWSEAIASVEKLGVCSRAYHWAGVASITVMRRAAMSATRLSGSKAIPGGVADRQVPFEAVVVAEVQAQQRNEVPRPHRAVRDQHTVGQPGRARGVEDDRGV